MNLTPTLTIDGQKTTSGITIRSGESIGPIALTWQNADGTERSMAGATAKWRLIKKDHEVEVVPLTSLADPASFYVAGATTAGWARGKHIIQFWEERLAGQPLERDNDAEIELTVK